MQNRVLRTLVSNENTVVGIKKWKYVLIKECLNKAIQDLDAWQKIFDPSSSLTMQLASPLIYHELAEGDETQVGSKCKARKLRDSLKHEPKIRASISSSANDTGSSIQ